MINNDQRHSMLVQRQMTDGEISRLQSLADPWFEEEIRRLKRERDESQRVIESQCAREFFVMDVPLDRHPWCV